MYKFTFYKRQTRTSFRIGLALSGSGSALKLLRIHDTWFKYLPPVLHRYHIVQNIGGFFLQVNTRLHNEIHFLNLRNAELTEQLNAENTKAAEFENKYEDAEYALNKVS
jgi:hypothetical protein